MQIPDCPENLSRRGDGVLDGPQLSASTPYQAIQLTFCLTLHGELGIKHVLTTG
jgi:hypothetical protein